MARGRMLNQKISKNKQVAELYDRVGPDAVIFYTWLIAYLDVEGRVHGDPVVLKGMVAPRLSGCTVEVIEQALSVATELGLVEWYDVEGEAYVCYPKFRENQVGLRVKREPKSELPEPSGTLPAMFRQPSGNLPAVCRQSSGNMSAEQNRTEENRTEEKKIDPKLKSIVSGTLEYYLEHFPKRTKQAKDPKSKAKVMGRAKEGYTLGELKKAVDGCLASSHHVEGGYDSIELIFRDAAHVDRFMHIAEHGDPAERKTNNGYHPWETDIEAVVDRFANKEIDDAGY